MKLTKHIGAVTALRGDARLGIEAGQCKGVCVTDGASIRFVNEGGQEWVVASGRGSLAFDFYAPEPGELRVLSDHADGLTSVQLASWGPVPAAEGWIEGESFVQLEPKAADDIPQAVRDMMARMEVNARRREDALRAELERVRQGR